MKKEDVGGGIISLWHNKYRNGTTNCLAVEIFTIYSYIHIRAFYWKLLVEQYVYCDPIFVKTKTQLCAFIWSQIFSMNESMCICTSRMIRKPKGRHLLMLTSKEWSGVRD